jgi:ATP-dependent helicase/nuclease subunit A
MSQPSEILTRTEVQQAAVSDPAVSAWVSANAGAGKTTVLVRRVIRLLLAGVKPARILCLTFTKAAAANMANKVLATLSAWVRLDDAALDAEIRKISPLSPSPALRPRARRLFAEAVETPGGLKVQTIHAFCDRVLHQFPFEAGVQAGFKVLDEVEEAELLERTQRLVLAEAASTSESELGRAFAKTITATTDNALREVLAEAVRDRHKITKLDRQNADGAIAAALGLQAAETLAAVEDAILASPYLPPEQWPAAAETLGEGGKTEQELAARLRAATAARGGARARTYLQMFLTKDGELRNRARFFTKSFSETFPELAVRLDREFDRMIGLMEKLRAAEARERTAALLTLARAVIRRYGAEKRARGALDYADLIAKTAAMFDDFRSLWVLYKLDGGIDHVLIDEAQDTSPEQWEVIARLTEEFFAGEGARGERLRTIFAVGDEKQSIFSFQGADPREFERMRREFERRVTDAGKPFKDESLDLSFRSAPGVLKAIDEVFARPEASEGLSSGAAKKTIHEAIRRRAPALVEVWPTEKPEEDEDDGEAWDAPLDARSESSPIVRLAQKIAAATKHWLGGGLTIADRHSDQLRAPRAGDVIVLVRRRGPLFEAILQALRRADVPVAGADRLHLTEHIAVMDLMALGDALSLEADDHALACALKSPLFGLDDDDLFAIAHGRSGTLAASLRSNDRYRQAAEKLARWRSEAAALRPFDFFSRVLGRDGGRTLMLARLGLEAADAIDEFLARALAYEQMETPSLGGFLAFLRRTGTEVKRDLEVESEAVRVMTVHGAKGLEAPIIVLADTTSMPDGRHDAKLLPLPDSDAVCWALRKELDSDGVRAAREAARKAREAEYRRLLYVALTRAADALIVCGAESKRQGKTELPKGCWYRLVRDALEGGLEEVPAPAFAGTVLRWRPEQAGRAVLPALEAPKPILLPSWAKQMTAPAPPPPKRIAPSRLDPDDKVPSAFARGASGALDARRRGDLVHRLLQYLPGVSVGRRKSKAMQFLAVAADELAETDRQQLAEEAIGVIEEPALADLFGPTSRAEVELIGRLPMGEVSGRVDRLAVTADVIAFADFKSGTPPARSEDIPQNYLAQLRIYRDVLAKIYPGRAMRALLVWTAGPAIHEISPQQLDALPAISAFTAVIHD